MKMEQMNLKINQGVNDCTVQSNSFMDDLYKRYPTGILDDVDLREVLKISRRTSLEYRQKGYIRFHRFADDSKIFYLLDELIEDIRKSSK